MGRRMMSARRWRLRSGCRTFDVRTDDVNNQTYLGARDFVCTYKSRLHFFLPSVCRCCACCDCADVSISKQSSAEVSVSCLRTPLSDSMCRRRAQTEQKLNYFMKLI